MGLDSINRVQGSARVGAVASEQERARKEKHGDEFSSELRHEHDDQTEQHEEAESPRKPAADSVVLGYEGEVSMALGQQGGLKLSLSSLRPIVPEEKPAVALKTARISDSPELEHIDSLV